MRIDLLGSPDGSPERTVLSRGEVNVEITNLRENAKRDKAKWGEERKLISDDLIETRKRLAQVDAVLIQSRNEKKDLEKERNRLKESVRCMKDSVGITQEESEQKAKEHKNNLQKMKDGYHREVQKLKDEYDESIGKHQEAFTKKVNEV